ncbi:MAG: ATP-binding protein [Patescibacteria group bacterium]|mgnify:CR=1 FL=1
MRKNLLLAEHLTISSVVLFIMLGAVFASFSLVEDILTRPQRYFSTELSSEEIQFILVHISFVIISVLASYIIYLVLSLHTRTEITVFNTTKSLAASLEQFVKFYEEAPVPYIIIDKSGKIINPNKAALRFFGVVLEEIKEKDIFHYQPEEDKDRIEKLTRYYKGNIPINREEVRIVTKSGAIKWALLSIFETKDPESFARTGLVTIFDITEQKQLDQAKTEFVSLASHQLRTPVATVKWYVEMLLSGNMGEFSPKQNDYLGTVYKVNEEMIDLVETLLNVSRVEIGSVRVESKPTNAIDLTEGILVELSPQIETKKINIERQYDDNLRNIESDPKLLRIVIQNLISNAVKYTPDGGTVAIRFKESLGENIIVVSDNGIGIPENQQNKVFTKMFRADNAHNLTGSQGTGLGLYLVKSIIEAMGGNISFISKEDEGSTFTIKL